MCRVMYGVSDGNVYVNGIGWVTVVFTVVGYVCRVMCRQKCLYIGGVLVGL